MFYRYIDLYPSKPQALKLIDSITHPNSQIINIDDKIEFIVEGIKYPNTDNNLLHHLRNNAKEYGELALEKLINEWIQDKNSLRILESIKAFDLIAVNYLAERLDKEDYAKELIATFGDLSFKILKEKLQDENKEVRYAAADALVYMHKFHPEIVKPLTDVISQENLYLIAKNYPFYIRLGIPGTEDLLIKALDRYFSETMCLDFLNCGNSLIELNAMKIAEQNGYIVSQKIGHYYGPKWGEGN